MIGVTDNYAPPFGRQELNLWTGAFMSEHVGFAWELPKHNGYMVRANANTDLKLKVSCPAPRTDENYEIVDAALEKAVIELEAAARVLQEVKG